MLSEFKIGQLEIKKRNVRIELDKLRNEIRCDGDKCATLLLTGVGSSATAILGRRKKRTRIP